MKIVKINSNSKNQTLEKMTIPADSVVFVLYDPHHKPVIQIFKDVNHTQIRPLPIISPEVV